MPGTGVRVSSSVEPPVATVPVFMNKVGIRSTGDGRFHLGLPLGERHEDRPCLATNRQTGIYICCPQFGPTFQTPPYRALDDCGVRSDIPNGALQVWAQNSRRYDSFRAKCRLNTGNVGDVRISRGLSRHSRGDTH